MIPLLVILMVVVSGVLYLCIQIAISGLGKRPACDTPSGWQIEDLQRLVDEGHCKSEAIADMVQEVIDIGPWSSMLDPSFTSILRIRLDAMDAAEDEEACEELFRAKFRLAELEAVAEAVRVERALMRALPDHTIQQLYGLGLPESAMTQVSLTLDALDKEEE